MSNILTSISWPIEIRQCMVYTDVNYIVLQKERLASTMLLCHVEVVKISVMMCRGGGALSIISWALIENKGFLPSGSRLQLLSVLRQTFPPSLVTCREQTGILLKCNSISRKPVLMFPPGRLRKQTPWIQKIIKESKELICISYFGLFKYLWFNEKLLSKQERRESFLLREIKFLACKK